MQQFLDDLAEQWRSQDPTHWRDVIAIRFHPGETQMAMRWPHGCQLTIWEAEAAKNWAVVEDHHAYRQTRVCQKHGVARIHVVSGQELDARRLNLQDLTEA